MDVRALWTALGGDPGDAGVVATTGPPTVLPSRFDVTGLAVASVAAASLAAARLWAARNRRPTPAVTAGSRAASAAFRSEALFRPHGWTLPPVWDPIAGDYRTGDGWIRLHTNYAHHRAAVAAVLGTSDLDRSAVADRVGTWSGTELESAVVAAGGCAAVMHDRPQWIGTPAGAAASAEPLAHIQTHPAASPSELDRPDPMPYAGIRVLDLTRVIAGPVATRFLAAYGADVLRLDPVGFAEVPALVPDTTVGKRRAALDLHSASGRAAFEALLADAHVLVCGLRPDALDRLGFTGAVLRDLNPGLVVARMDAYGWTGPWQHRRGFDSLVQMSCGIAAAAGADRPVPLPAQALDHATGYLIAAGVGAALVRLVTTGRTSELRFSLVGTANVLMAAPGDPSPADPQWTDTDTEPCTTAWGPARRVPPPGHIDGVPARWSIDAGPLGRDQPVWE